MALLCLGRTVRIAVALLALPLHAAQTYNLLSQYDNASNPSSSGWSYGYRTSSSGAFTVFPWRGVSYYDSGYVGWTLSAAVRYPEVNRDATTMQACPDSSSQSFSGARWTSTTNGTATVTATFDGYWKPGDPGVTVACAYVFTNNMVGFQQDINNNVSITPVSFSRTVVVKPGDTIDFMVGPNTVTGSNFWSRTFLTVNISVEATPPVSGMPEFTLAAGEMLTLPAGETLSGGVTVASGATLAGVGAIAGGATVDGTLDAGTTDVEAGTMTFDGGLTLNAGGMLRLHLFSDSTCDQIVGTGGTTQLGGSLVLVMPAGYVPAGRSFAVLSNTVAVGGVFVNVVSNTVSTLLADGSGTGRPLTVAVPGGVLVQVSDLAVLPDVWLASVTNAVTATDTNITIGVHVGNAGSYQVWAVDEDASHGTWRLVGASNTVSAFSVVDTEAAGTNLTRYYRTVRDDGGILETNRQLFAVHDLPTRTGQWYKLSMPLEAGSNTLDSALGRYLKTGLGGGDMNGDLVYVLDAGGQWRRYDLDGTGTWTSNAVPATGTVAPWQGIWIKRRSSGPAVTNSLYAGPMQTNEVSVTFRSNAWHLIAWPFATPWREDDRGGSNPGWGFAAAGAQRGNSYNNADNLVVGSGAAVAYYYLNTDGRWYRPVTGGGAAVPDATLKAFEGYYYYHRGTGFTWTVSEP